MFKKGFFVVPFLFTLLFTLSSHTSAKELDPHEATYQNLLNAITSYKSTATFPSQSISYKDVGSIINEVLADHPEIFYFQHDGTKIYSDGKIELKYKYSTSKINEMVKNQDAKINSILKDTIKSGFSDFDKVKAIHDYIILHTAYDWENYKQNKVPESSYTPYGLLMNGMAVCEGYSLTMKLLLEKVGIETHYVTGKGKEGDHAWNLVKMDGEYFYIDTTWDDPVPNRAGEISYQYFLVPASVLKKDHTWNEKLYPEAKSNKYAYFQEFFSVKELNSYYYYSNSKDNNKLYRMKKDGSGKTKLLNVSSPYFVVTNQAIYFSNYSNGGYLYRSNIDGSKQKQLNKIHSIDLYIENNKLNYTNKATGKKGSIKIS